MRKVTAHTYLATLAGVCCSISSARMVAFDPETDFVVTPWIEKQLKRRLGKDEVVIGGKVEGIDLLETTGETWLLGMKFKVAATLDVTGTPLDNTDYEIPWRAQMIETYVAGALRELAGLPLQTRAPQHGLWALESA